ncbi:MAG: hypothetical protein AAF752_07175, partial [Bacteroidota bacterium]
TAYSIESRGIVRPMPIQTPTSTLGPTTGLALDLPSGYLYAASNGAIWRSDIDGEGGELHLATGSGSAQSLRLDSQNGFLYWTNGTAILRSSLASSGVTTLRTESETITGLDIDPDNGQMYWTLPNAGEVWQGSTDGATASALFSGRAGVPSYVRVDQAGYGSLYWTELGNAVYRSDLDRAGLTRVAAPSSGSPTSLALYADAPAAYLSSIGPSSIKALASDGSGLSPVYSATSLSLPSNLTSVGRAIDPPRPNLTVHVKRPPTGWGLPRVAWFSTTPSILFPPNGSVPMLYEGCGWYTFTLPGAHTASIEFNGYPGNFSSLPIIDRDRELFYDIATETAYDARPDPECTDRSELTVRTFLSGAFDDWTGLMSTTLDASMSLPLEQPFDGQAFEQGPMHYFGRERRTARQPVTDWVLLELRTGAARAEDALQVVAALIEPDGTIIAPDGTPPAFNVPKGDYTIVVRHRNHLPIMSRFPVNFLANSPRIWDITANPDSVAGTSPLAFLNQSSPLYGLRSGDADQNGEVTVTDLIDVLQPAIVTSAAGYVPADLNLDGVADNEDTLRYFFEQSGQFSYVPDVPPP